MTIAAERDWGTPEVDLAAGASPVTVSIDGIPVEVPVGTSVLRAAAAAGVAIPRACATESLAAYGSCRLCLVEVEGGRGIPASVSYTHLTLPTSDLV